MATLIRKQPAATDDYQTAFNIVNSLKTGNSENVIPDNIKAFRKYLCDLGGRQGKKYTTRKNAVNLFIMRIE